MSEAANFSTSRVQYKAEYPPGFPYGRQTNVAFFDIAETLRDETGAMRMQRCSDGGYYVMEGPAGQERYTQFVHANEGMVCTFRRIYGMDREVRRVYENGWVAQFYDYRQDGFLRVRGVKASEGRHIYYEGANRHSLRLVMAIQPNGNFCYFEGAPGEERRVRTWVPKHNSGRMPDYLVHCAGPRGAVYVTHIEYADGRASYYEGTSSGTERLVKRISAKGTASTSDASWPGVSASTACFRNSGTTTLAPFAATRKPIAMRTRIRRPKSSAGHR